MNRRGFIQITSVAAIPILLGVFPKKNIPNYTIKVRSNRKFGHLIRDNFEKEPTKTVKTDIVIVGGGVAGISAAASLNGYDFMLFEGADRLGGTSASSHWKTTEYAMGAHYELSYPQYFGKEVLSLLEEIGVIENPFGDTLHHFVENKYLVPNTDLEQCFYGNEVYEDVLDKAEGAEEFRALLAPFMEKMPLPTRLIDPSYHYLNELTFKDWIERQMSLSQDLKRRIDYQMLDDWGGTSDQVSALCGIHYYTCRPYESEDVKIFAHPRGNSYFTEKLIGNIDKLESLFTDTYVKSITEHTDGIDVEVMNRDLEVTLVRCKSVIYAGQKHGLPYVMKSESKELPIPEYAPWIVLNLICRKGITFEKWQNDVITDDIQFLGFINSSKQNNRSTEYDVFTVYYCLNEEHKNLMTEVESNPEQITEQTIAVIKEYTDTDVAPYLEHVSINLMGHAMPIPKPYYLALSDTPKITNRIVLAGVDSGRLPLFYEACDSGIQAAAEVKKLSKKHQT